jgi:hypothetical protein
LKRPLQPFSTIADGCGGLELLRRHNLRLSARDARERFAHQPKPTMATPIMEESHVLTGVQE